MAVVIIDGVRIKDPQLKKGTFRLSEAGRVASGDMVMEIIAIKTRIDLTWRSIRGRDLNKILDLLDANTFYEVQFSDSRDPSGMTTKTMYVGDINQTLYRTDGYFVWENVTLPLIEQ